MFFENIASELQTLELLTSLSITIHIYTEDWGFFMEFFKNLHSMCLAYVVHDALCHEKHNL